MDISKLKINFEYNSLFNKSQDWWVEYKPPIFYINDDIFLNLFAEKINFWHFLYSYTNLEWSYLNVKKIIDTYFNIYTKNENTPKKVFLDICNEVFIPQDLIIKYRKILPWPILCRNQKFPTEFIDQILILEKQDKQTYIIWYIILQHNLYVNHNLLFKYQNLIDKQNQEYSKELENQKDFWG